jgi:maltooligosyltrehalose trehalohydrolase
LKIPISTGRREFLSQFPSVTDPEVLATLPSPVAEETFRRCKLDLGERERHHEWYALHRDLIHLRRNDPVFLRAADRRPDGAVIAPGGFILRFFGDEDGDRLLVVNLGCDLDLRPLPEPLLAPPIACHWDMHWSSEAPRYGGGGTPPMRPHSHLHVPGAATILLRSEPGGIDDPGQADDDV